MLAVLEMRFSDLLKYFTEAHGMRRVRLPKCVHFYFLATIAKPALMTQSLFHRLILCIRGLGGN